MTQEKLVRTTLWLSLPFNLVAAYAVGCPSSAIGQLLQLPSNVPVVYAYLLAYLIALFGVLYGFMAQQAEISRSLLLAGVVGKTGVFVILGLLWAGSQAAFPTFLVTWGDLGFAAIWGSWLWQTRN